MKIALLFVASIICFVYAAQDGKIEMTITRSYTTDSLGACQGISYQDGRIFLYGDRETGMIREYAMSSDSLHYLGNEIKLTINDTDLINHPTGIACSGNLPVFIGNSIRLNKEGTQWKAVIYCVDWKKLQQTHRLDGCLLNTIEDDACIQGTRPEYVQYKKKWYVATADYGDHGNEVRLYDPALLQHARKTTDSGVLYKKFTCTPWVQNLHWVAKRKQLVLIQNQTEGRKWRFTFLNLQASVENGKQSPVKIIDIDRNDELEGFSLVGSPDKGIAVTSSRSNNINSIHINW